MIARDAEPLALKLPAFSVDFQTPSFGDELPSVNCDLADLNISTNEFDQLLLQSLKDIPLSLDGLSMDYEGPTTQTQFISANQPLSEVTNVFGKDETNMEDIEMCGNGIFNANANIPTPLEPNFVQFFQNLRGGAVGSGRDSKNASSTATATTCKQRRVDVTPPYSGGSTPQTQSRAASPAWSESSGNMSTSSVSGLSCPRKASGESVVPRHKRPSHRRAEVKRRDKIKTCLDEIKESVPSLQDKGKLSESAILFKAAEHMHQLKDGFSERGNKAAELRREIQSLSEEIHSFQEALPAGGLKQEAAAAHPGLDELYSDWVAQQNKISTKHYIFHSITASLFDSFKSVLGNASTLDSMACRVQDWQTRCLSLPILRKQILNGMLKLTRDSSVVTFPKDLNLDSSVDGNS